MQPDLFEADAVASDKPWMPLYVGDYLRDTRRLSLAEHGAYLLLIMEIWTHGEVPDDDRRISRILGCSTDEWAAIRPEVSEFFEISNGRWRHGRVNKEFGRSDGISEKRREAGKKGAKSRWQNDGKDGFANGKSMANAIDGKSGRKSGVSGKKNAKKGEDADGKSIANDGYPQPHPQSQSQLEESPPNGGGEIDAVVDLWNSYAEAQGWSRVFKVSPKRRGHIKGRLKSYGFDTIKAALDRASNAEMLIGADPPKWFDFDFLIRSDDSIAKIMEGKYDRAFNRSRSSWNFDNE